MQRRFRVGCMCCGALREERETKSGIFARMSNRAVVQTKFPGKGEGSLELVHRPIPKASAGNVVIRLSTRSVNPNDLTNIRDNKLQSFQDNQHPVIGSECCGLIFEVVDDVRD